MGISRDNHYDDLNQLTREDDGVLDKTITYSYDLGGNILAKNEYEYTTGTPGTPVKTYSYLYDSVWKDKLIGFGEPGSEDSITYDDIGNPLNDGTFTYTWTQGLRLATLTGSGLSASYNYNDSGIRTQKTVNGVTTDYYLVGGRVTYEKSYDANEVIDEIYYTYDSVGDLVSFNLNGTEYYYIRNAQNDIIGIFDKEGTKVVSYTYDSWGKLISIDGDLASTVGIKNPYRYRGYRYDTETGLYYLQSRYYNPERGRFLNADAIAGQVGTIISHNAFTYCGNNPVNNIDPNGFFAIPLIYYGVVAAFLLVASYAVLTTAPPLELPVPSNSTINTVSSQRPDISNIPNCHKKTGSSINPVPLLPPQSNPKGQTVYRIHGGQSSAYGQSWTPIDPRTVNNPRDYFGLPDENSGGRLSIGILHNSTGIKMRPALPYRSPTTGKLRPGGGIEYIIPYPREQIIITETVEIFPPF